MWNLKMNYDHCVTVHTTENAMQQHSYSQYIASIRNEYSFPFEDSSKSKQSKQDRLFQDCEHAFNLMRHKAQDNDSHLGKPNRWMQNEEDIHNRQVNATLPDNPEDSKTVISQLINFFEGLSDPNHPLTLQNILPPPCTPSIVANLFAAKFNPNLVDDLYCWNIAAAEVEVVGMTAKLVGLDPAKAKGFMSFSGTGNYMYATKLALIQTLGIQSRQFGVREDAKIITSTSGHYIKLTIADWLGLGTNNVIQIPVHEDHSMDTRLLREQLENCFSKGEKVALIVATMGTTDAFGVDDVEEIVNIRDQLVQKYNIPPENQPFVYCDAVIGWTWTVFNSYDFKSNPLNFPAKVVQALEVNSSKFQKIHLSDAIGVDFHKTGFAPYSCSLFLLADGAKFDLLQRERSQMSYLFNFSTYSVGKFTLETSRSAAPALAAWASLKYFGVKGYQAMIGHLTESQLEFREMIANHKNWIVVNSATYGLSTLFRVYPVGVDAKLEWEREFEQGTIENVKQNNNYQFQFAQKLFELRMIEGSGPALSLSSHFTHNKNDASFAALKIACVTPFVDSHIPVIVQEYLLKAEAHLNSDDSQGK